MTRSTASLHQTVAIQHRMNGAFGRYRDTGEPADQALSDLTSTPGGVLALHVQDIVLHLKRKLVGIPIGTPASVGQPLNATFLIAIEDLITRLAGDRELSAEFRHRLAGSPASHKLQPFVHHRTLLPRHHSLPQKKEKKCNLCVRYDLSPMSRVAHSRLPGVVPQISTHRLAHTSLHHLQQLGWVTSEDESTCPESAFHVQVDYFQVRRDRAKGTMTA